MPEDLPGPDELIGLARAARLIGVAPTTLRDAARAGRLQTVQPAHDLLTTRRWLHAWALRRKAVPGRHAPAPLPADYVPPEG